MACAGGQEDCGLTVVVGHVYWSPSIQGVHHAIRVALLGSSRELVAQLRARRATLQGRDKLPPGPRAICNHAGFDVPAHGTKNRAGERQVAVRMPLPLFKVQRVQANCLRGCGHGGSRRLLIADALLQVCQTFAATHHGNDGTQYAPELLGAEGGGSEGHRGPIRRRPLSTMSFQVAATQCGLHPQCAHHGPSSRGPAHHL
mmetsp:Transcript_4683/g.17667  ORF Transcript_4683/g.17667 Transcript_4683/m.17667 type:complete len:201 (-) Transcript_4683:684-1286(-)